MSEEELSKPKGPDFKDVEDGPLSSANRECRDVICCLLFLVNIGGMIFCAFYGFLNGNPSFIYRATSSDGDICGISSDTIDLPFAYFYNPVATDYKKRVCVKECPTYTNGSLLPLTCKSGQDCSYTVTILDNGTAGVSTSVLTNSPFIGYETQEFLGRICIPTTVVLQNALSTASSALATTLQQGSIANFITDVQNVSTYQEYRIGICYWEDLESQWSFLLCSCSCCDVWLESSFGDRSFYSF